MMANIRLNHINKEYYLEMYILDFLNKDGLNLLNFYSFLHIKRFITFSAYLCLDDGLPLQR